MSAPDPSGVSVISAILAPEAELVLHRPVREAEQHGLCVGAVRRAMPARRNENVARAPAESLLADLALALALHADEHRAVGAPIGRCREALRQELHEGRDGRHGVVAGGWIDVAHLIAVVGVGLVV